MSKPASLHQWPMFIIQMLPLRTEWEDHLFFFEWNFERTTWQFVCNMEPMYTSKILNQPFGSIQVHVIMGSIIMNEIRQHKKLNGIQQHMPRFIGRFKELWVNGYYKHWAISLSGRLSPNWRTSSEYKTCPIFTNHSNNSHHPILLPTFFVHSCRSWEGCLAGASQLQNPRRRVHSQQKRIGEEHAHTIAKCGDSTKQSRPRLQSRRLALHRWQYGDRNSTSRWMASKS